MRGNLGTDRVQREEHRLCHDVQSKVGEKRNEQRNEHDQTQHTGQYVRPVAQQQITEPPARTVEVPVNALGSCRACGSLLHLLYSHSMLPLVNLDGHLRLCYHHRITLSKSLPAMIARG